MCLDTARTVNLAEPGVNFKAKTVNRMIPNKAGKTVLVNSRSNDQLQC